MELVLGGTVAVDTVVDTEVEDIVMATEQADMEDPVIGLEAADQEVVEADQEVVEADQEAEAEAVAVEVVVTAVEDIVKLMRNPEMPLSTYPPSISAKACTPCKLPYNPPVSSSMSSVHPHRTAASEDRAKSGPPPPQPESVFYSL